MNTAEIPSALANWPVQIKLAPVNAPCFHEADLLIAADCTAFAYGSFHRDFMAGKVTLIGCPKLDGVNYADKLSKIFAHNSIRSIHVLRMQVPCCCGLPFAVKAAQAQCGKDIPCYVTILSPTGEIIQSK